ncbi:MAG: hypothetical protein QNJ69_13370 [Gammaproteobacteria bacterium]|nr:hypothetical protein [Gammaproteobacteria bacterium]
MVKRFIGWSAAVVAVIVALFASKYFIQPISSDLSAVGQGQPSLVLAYENFSPVSGAMLNQLNSIRQDYQDVMNFAVADLGTPEGKAFARQYNISNGIAVFLSADGQPLRVSMLTDDEQALRNLLDEKLALIGITR